MDYFDNSPLVEIIARTTNSKHDSNGNMVQFLIAGIIVTSTIAAVFVYKYHSLSKKDNNSLLHHKPVPE